MYHFNLIHSNGIETVHRIVSVIVVVSLQRDNIEVSNTTDQITLHSKGLNIVTSGIQVTPIKPNGKLGNRLTVAKAAPEKDYDFFTITMRNPLTASSRYVVMIPFHSIVSEGFVGYYRSSFLDMNNERRYIAVTQFQPTSAREAFPCFDEPAMKATFEISIGHHKNLSALSNMPLRDTDPLLNYDEGFVLDHFEESVPMSTYIVAYAVVDFVYVESMVQAMQKDRLVQFRTWARAGAFSQLQYASEVGPSVLQYLERYFNIDYPLPKVDQLAIPDFEMGAMENWGMVTFRESELLYEPNVTSLYTQGTIGRIISHELSHMWFGNLVTMAWWSDLWLNEGFATYMSTLCLANLHPEFNSYIEDSLNNLRDVFEVDMLKTSRPVSKAVNDFADIKSMFDAITYSKGASVVRMMHFFLGDEVFREGVSNYLRKFAYRNAERGDLWESLTESAHKHEVLPKDLTVGKIMDTWILQTGYPIINVERNYSDNTAVITQKRFLAANVKSSKDEQSCWWLPLSYTNADQADFESTRPRKWAGCDARGIEVPVKIENIAAENAWVIFNIGQSSLYRVQYDNNNWRLLIEYLTGPDYKKISTSNRAQIVSDALDLASSGVHSDYGIALDLLEYLQKERDYIPWNAAAVKLEYVIRMLARSPEYGSLQEYFQGFFEPMFNEVGGLNVDRNEGDSYDIVKFKVLIHSYACKMNVEGCVSQARDLFKEWQAHPERNPIPSDLRNTVYCTAIRTGNERDWQFLWQQYQTSEVASELFTIRAALTCSRQPWLLQRLLEWSLDESTGIRKQDSAFVFMHVTRNDVGYYVAKSFLMERAGEIYNYMLPTTTALTRYVERLADHLRSQKEYDQMTLVSLLSSINGVMGSSILFGDNGSLCLQIWIERMHQLTIFGDKNAAVVSK